MLTEDAFNELTAKIARLRDERAKLIEEVATLHAYKEVMTARLEQQAAEIAALRESISRMGDAALKLRDTIAALNAKPDAEPAPVENAAIKVGDTVRVVKLSSAYHDNEGKVIQIAGHEIEYYVVRFLVDGFPHVESDVAYTRNEIEPA